MHKIRFLLTALLLMVAVPVFAQDSAPTDPAITPENAAFLRPTETLGYGRVFDAESSPAGNQIAVGTATGAWLFDTLYISAIHLSDSPTLALAWNRDGTRLATGHLDGTLRVWDVASQSAQIAIQAHQGTVNDLAWSPDNTQIITGGSDGAVHLWESSDGSEFYQLPRLLDPTDGTSPQNVSSVAISLNGQIVSATQHGLYQWNTQLGIAEQINGYGIVAAFSPNGATLATLQWEDQLPYIVLLDALTYAPIQRFTPNFNPLTGSVRWSPDGRQIAYRIYPAQGGGVHLVNVETGEGDSVQGETITQFLWSSDSLRLSLFTYDGRLLTYSPADERLSQVATGFTGTVDALAWSPDGTQIAVLNTHLQVWDVAASRQTGAFTFPDGVDAGDAVAYSADASQIIGDGWAFSLADQTISAAPGLTTLRASFAQFGITASAFGLSADGARLVTQSDDGMLRLYESATGVLQAEYPTPYRPAGNTLSFSPDGRLIAAPVFYEDVLGARQNAFIVWDASTGAQLAQLPSNGGVDVEFSPDGTRLATADSFGAVVIYAVSA